MEMSNQSTATRERWREKSRSAPAENIRQEDRPLLVFHGDLMRMKSFSFVTASTDIS